MNKKVGALSALVLSAGLVFGGTPTALANSCPWNPAPVQGNEQPAPSQDVPTDIPDGVGDLGNTDGTSGQDPVEQSNETSSWWDRFLEMIGIAPNPSGGSNPGGGAPGNGGGDSPISSQPGDDKTEKVGGVTKGSSAKAAELINAERQKHGLKAVPVNQANVKEAQECAISNVSRFARGDRSMRHCGYENLMASPTEMSAQALVQGWMNSPGHRAAILNPKATSVGVGWATAPNGGYIYAANLSINW